MWSFLDHELTRTATGREQVGELLSQVLAGKIDMAAEGRLKLSNGVLEGWDTDRHAKRRALKELEKAGLVSVKRHHGCSPVVTILDAPPTDNRGARPHHSFRNGLEQQIRI